jgi:hypothetical protein
MHGLCGMSDEPFTLLYDVIPDNALWEIRFIENLYPR